MKFYTTLCFVALLAFTSCTKTNTDEEDLTDCSILATIHATATTPVTIGQEITLSIPEVNGYRIYSWTGPDNFNSQYPSNTIYAAELKHEGWYYVNVSKPDCNSKIDSVYIDVKLTQGTPPCSKPANNASYSNLGDDNFISVNKQLYSGTSLLTLDATSGPTDLNISFHQHWSLTTEPEDGVYTTVNTLSFDPGNYDRIFVSMVKQNIYWASHDGQKVYISHTAAGKLQARYCSLLMSGSNGTSYTTSASANIIQQ